MFIEISILSQLMGAPSHGYEIKKRTAERFGPYFVIRNNQLYPKLRSLEKDGFITKEIMVQDGKPNRHIYSITELGIGRFYELLGTFPEEYAADEHEYLTRVGYFDILDEEAQQDILSKRRKVLCLEYEHMEYLMELRRKEKFIPYSKEYFQFSMDSIHKELALIESLLQRYGMAEMRADAEEK